MTSRVACLTRFIASCPCRRLPLAVLTLSWFATPHAPAGAFTRIADTSTPIPNGAENFSTFGPPILSGSTVAFWGNDGIYASESPGGQLSLIADLNTAIPAGVGNFTYLNSKSISGSTIVFRATGGMDQIGIYTASTTGGPLSKIVDRNTAIPNGTGTFFGMSSEVVSDSMVAFGGGSQGNSQRGIFVGSTSGGPLTSVVDVNSPIPGGIGNFERMGQPGIAIHGTNVAWYGTGGNLQQGIYLGSTTGGAITRVADTNVEIPDGTGDFTGFYWAYLSASNVTFNGRGSDGQQGIYTSSTNGGPLTRVADLNTPVPMGNGSFSQLIFSSSPSVSVSGTRIAFRGLGSDSQVGIYTNAVAGGVLHKVVAAGDVLDGKTVSDLEYGIDSLDGPRLAFLAIFTDGTSGVYTTLAPTCNFFGGDDTCDIDDLNALLMLGPLAPGIPAAGQESFDLTGDGLIDNADVDQWLATAATVNGFASPYFRGDANLDGSVDVSDFNIWNSNRFSLSLAWDRGDFNGDGVVDASDFNVWNSHRLMSSAGAPAAVPEPASLWLALVAMGWLAAHRGRG